MFCPTKDRGFEVKSGIRSGKSRGPSHVARFDPQQLLDLPAHLSHFGQSNGAFMIIFPVGLAARAQQAAPRVRRGSYNAGGGRCDEIFMPVEKYE